MRLNIERLLYQLFVSTYTSNMAVVSCFWYRSGGHTWSYLCVAFVLLTFDRGKVPLSTSFREQLFSKTVPSPGPIGVCDRGRAALQKGCNESTVDRDGVLGNSPKHPPALQSGGMREG